MVVFNKMNQVLNNRLRRVGLTVFCLCTVVLSAVTWAVVPVFSQDDQDTPSTFEISLAELGYRENVLGSPYRAVEYSIRLPEGWELQPESFFELDFSYIQEWMTANQDGTLPGSFGDLIVAIDGEIKQSISLDETFIEHSRLRVDLDPAHFNDPYWIGRNHSVRVTLDASSICNVSHRARVVVHPTSVFSLIYTQLPITTDLALYPRPFYQRSFDPDQVRFVLPERPAEAELAGATAVAARLGSLTFGMVISGTTDSMLLARVDAEIPPAEHLVVVGKPETNQVIERLDEMGVLPVSLRERELSLSTEGPAVAAPLDVLTYTLVLTNTARRAISSFSLVDSLPVGADLVDCSPSCVQNVEQRTIKWSVPSLEMGQAISYVFRLRSSEAITGSVLDNTVVLLDASSEPVNVSTITTTVRSDLLAGSDIVFHSVSGVGERFFVQDGRAVPESDGIVQEIVSPWEQNRGILLITGLTDSAVSRASRAMSSMNQFPGPAGTFALIKETQLPPQAISDERSLDRTFADLGYDDRLIGGSLQQVDYSFLIPLEWQLADSAYLELFFKHSQRINYENSALTVLMNDTPIATISLDNRTALNGYLKVNLPASQAIYGRNRITVQGTLQSTDPCTTAGEWVFISSESLLHLAHRENGGLDLLLDFYPYPFGQHPNLEDVLFVLSPEPTLDEWEDVLQLGYSLGRAATGSNLMPAVALGEGSRSEADLSNYNLIAIGRPSRNWIVRRVNELLPQPFLPGLDQIDQKLNSIVLRISPGTDLGYIQLVASPWNKERAFLAVTGTTDQGVAWASEALIGSSWALRGNLALVRKSGISTIDTRGLTSEGVVLAVATVVPESTPVAAVTVTPMTTVTPGVEPEQTSSTPRPTYSSGTGADASARPAWIIPLVVVSAIVVIAVLFIAFWQSHKRGA